MKKIIIDQREVEDYEKGHYPSAINVPMQEKGNIEDVFNYNKLKEVITKEDLVLLYCYGGDCAEKTLKKLKDDGYNNVVNIGGYDHRCNFNDVFETANQLKDLLFKVIAISDKVESFEEIDIFSNVVSNTISCAVMNALYWGNKIETN